MAAEEREPVEPSAKLIWSPEAVDDLEQIVRYIERDSPEYASRVATAIVEAVERTATFPRIGREVPERNDPSLREVLAHRYRIIYRVSSGAVHVAAIVHGARDLTRALEGRRV